jgi:ankyrin repeat protein
MSGNSKDAIRLLIQQGAYINAVNDDLKSPLFMSVKANNPMAAAALVELNADYKLADNQGMTAFDSIKDISEWIRSDIFDKGFKTILKS